MDSKEFYLKHLKSDFSAGIVVFLIALPLCLGISMASGAPLFSGIIAGVVGGIVAGIFSGSQVNVSGPAASVALVILTAISTFGSYQDVLLAVILAGVIQIIMGYVGAGTIAYFFPSSMIKGILASIGIILILKQIPHSVGYDSVFEGSESFTQGDGHNTFSELYYMFERLNFGAIIITLVSLAIILLWDRPQFKKITFFKVFPAALAAVIVSIILNEIFKASFPNLILSGDRLVKLPVAGNLTEFLGFFALPSLKHIANPQIYMTALSIAFIASLESLLSTEAGDKLDPYRRRTSTNQELKAQGIGNIVSGLIGGLPITAVIVRTSANVSAGGRTKTATIVHGSVMLICAILIPNVLNMIPLAALAAVLFVVGYKLTSLNLITDMYKKGVRQFIPFMGTIAAVMFTDLITGIMIGGTISIFIITRDSYLTPFFVEKANGQNSDELKFVLSEEVTFLNKAQILKRLDQVEQGKKVVIDASKSVNIDPDVLEIFNEFKESAIHKNIDFQVVGLKVI